MIWSVIRSQLTQARVVPVIMYIVNAAVTLACTWLATRGWLNLDPAQVVAIVGPIALGGVGSVLHWQKGNREYEARGARVTEDVVDYDVHPDDLIPDVDDLDSEKAKAKEKQRVKR